MLGKEGKTDRKQGQKLLGEKMTILSLRSLHSAVNRSAVVQARKISAQAVKVESSARECAKTSESQQQHQTKYEEEFHNYLYLKSSLHEVYKIDLDARSVFYLKQ